MIVAKVKLGAVDQQGKVLDEYLDVEFSAQLYEKYVIISHPKLKRNFKVNYEHIIVYQKPL